MSTVLGRNVYSFVDGPKADPKRMAADEAGPDRSAQEAGIKRGSTLAELKTAYLLPIAGHDGWTILFELEGDSVKYVSMGGPN